MAESDVHVVFDPFVLSDALLGSEDSIEYKALETLVQNCPNKLVVDDESGKLGEAYQRALQEVFISLRSQLAERLAEESKVVEEIGLSEVAQVGGLRKQHRDFMMAALSTRPRYLVFRIRQWRSETLKQQLLRDYGVELLTSEEYINLF